MPGGTEFHVATDRNGCSSVSGQMAQQSGPHPVIIMPAAPQLPPRTTAPDGSPRRVGVEIEYAGPDAPEVVAMVQETFGGSPEESDPQCYKIRDTRLGDF